jgi:hypothetical protein
MNRNDLPIVVIGAGPVGLAAATHLAHRGERLLVVEQGNEPGSAIRKWSHVKLFSSWTLNVDPNARSLLEATGWMMPPADVFPTGQEFIDSYLKPLAQLPLLRDSIRYGQKVCGITRFGLDKMKRRQRELAPFELHLVSVDGKSSRVHARAVIDASGTWHNPNPAGATGAPAQGELTCSRIQYGIPDVFGAQRSRYQGKRIAVAGSGHSAINVLIDLARVRQETGTGTITWLLRGTVSDGAAVNAGALSAVLPARGELTGKAGELVRSGAVVAVRGFHTEQISELASGSLLIRSVNGGRSSVVEADELVVCTGFRPDLDLGRELHLTVDPWLECPQGVGELIREAADRGVPIPRAHGALELAHPEQDFYIVGSKSHGRAPNFFLTSGHEQVRSVAALLAGDVEAAQRVEFAFPTDGVCSGCGEGACCTSVSGESGQSCGNGGGCCGPATQDSGAQSSASCCA